MEKIKVACYCRVSTKKEEQMLSLEQQQQFFQGFTEKNNLDMYGLYVDDGISGKSLKKRENFKRMIEDAKKGLFSKILVKDISRFARNTLDFLSAIRDLKQYNVIIEFVTYNMTTLDSEFTLTILAAVAQEESAGLSRRVKFGKKQGAKNGRVPSMVYGYDRIDKYTLTPNPMETAVVQRIFDLYVFHQMSSLQIASVLNVECVPTKRGGANHWSQTVICNILKNQLYIGKVCNNKSEITDFLNGSREKFDESEWINVERPGFRIISDELFEKANSIREKRSNSFHQFEDADGKMKRKRPSIKYPLSNLLLCADDNYAFRRRHREYPSGYAYTYWTCSKRDMGANTCSNMTKIDEGQMHAAIITFLNQLYDNQDIIRKEFREHIGKELHMKYAQEIDRSGLLTERLKLSKKRDKIMDIYLDGEIDKEYLTSKLKPIDSRLAEIKVSLDVYDNQANIVLDIDNCLAKIMEKINMQSEDLLNNAFLKTIFEKFTVHADGKITAVLKIDTESGASLDIPFGEMVDDSQVSVPNHTNDI